MSNRNNTFELCYRYCKILILVEIEYLSLIVIVDSRYGCERLLTKTVL